MKGSIKQAGFTLVEIVVMITILGVLAAFAIPRFVSLENQTRTASRDALLVSLRSGAALAHALWLANGQTSPVSMAGKSVAIVNGYPSAAAISNALADTSGFTAKTAGTTTTFAISGPKTCIATYSEAATVHAAPTIVPGGGTC